MLRLVLALVWLPCSASLVGLWLPGQLSAGRPAVQVAANTGDLQTQLESGLRARRSVEFAFIQNVVRLVHNGRLPISVVKGSFHWARRRHLVIPYPYFERVMRLRAQKLGVVID